MTSLLVVSEHGSEALFAGIWHGGVLLTVVAIALRLLPRLTAATRSLIWTAAMFVVVALPFFPTHVAAGSGEGLQLAPVWSVAIAAIWAVLALVRAAQLMVSGVRLRRIWAKAGVVPSSDIFSVRTALGTTRTARLCVSDAIARPSVIGFFSPRILIPGDLYEQLTPAEIEQIVLHEMEHLRRGDDWRNLLQKVAVMLFPLNPALLWIERRLCFERELACDESVLAKTNAPKSYAACLVHLAEAQRFGRSISLALGAWERQSELGRRVHGILSSPKKVAVSHRFCAVSTGGLVVGMLALAAGLTQAPQMVSFAASPTMASSPAAPAGFEKVAMRDSQRVPVAHMVETMMRMPTTSPVKKVRVKVIPKLQPRLISERQAAPARMVLTSWDVSHPVQAIQSEEVIAPIRHLTFAVIEFSSYSYETAQPVRRLFIVQL